MTKPIAPTTSIPGIRRVDELEVEGRRVFVRVDFNVPRTPDGEVADDSRIQAALETIRHLQANGARIILASHLGRPKGKPDPKFSLEKVGAHLAGILNQEVLLPEDSVGDGPKRLVQNLREGQIVLLENVRFHAEEKTNDENFARQLASLADVYVNDAFGTAHRAHASVVGVASLLEERAAGFLMARELEALGALMRSPEKPFMAVLGGAKVSDKIGVIEALLDRVQCLVIGGAMANTFLAAQGYDMGASLVETDKLELARRVISKASNRGVELALPVDHVLTTDVSGQGGIRAAGNNDIVGTGENAGEWMSVDIGEKTRRAYADMLASARTVFWNGPMGIFEVDAFAKGTEAVAQAIAKGNAHSVVGGGDSVAAVKKVGVAPFINHISTGGGASLEFLEGKDLPGVEALLASRR